MRSTIGDRTLNQYSTSNAARDYHLAVSAVRKTLPAQQQVWFYAFSYGTNLLNRILTLFPNIAHGVMMDGVMYGQFGGQMFNLYDTGHQLSFNGIFKSCMTDDQRCASHVRNDKLPDLLMAQLEKGWCQPYIGNIINMADLRNSIRYNFVTSAMLREILPIWVFRAARCNPDLDGHFLQIMSHLYLELWQNTLRGDIRSTAQGLATSYNYIAGMNIISSEIFNTKLTLPQVLQPLLDSSLGSEPAESIGFYQISQTWPRYSEPLQYAINSANLSEVLFVSGEFDPRTPPYMAADVYRSPSAFYFFFRFGV